MGRYVAAGVMDVGLCGIDWIKETEADVDVVCDLVYSKASDQPCRWVLLVNRDSPIQKVEDLEGKVIATELVRITKRFLEDQNIKATVE